MNDKKKAEVDPLWEEFKRECDDRLDFERRMSIELFNEQVQTISIHYVDACDKTKKRGEKFYTNVYNKFKSQIRALHVQQMEEKGPFLREDFVPEPETFENMDTSIPPLPQTVPVIAKAADPKVEAATPLPHQSNSAMPEVDATCGAKKPLEAQSLPTGAQKRVHQMSNGVEMHEKPKQEMNQVSTVLHTIATPSHKKARLSRYDGGPAKNILESVVLKQMESGIVCIDSIFAEYCNDTYISKTYLVDYTQFVAATTSLLKDLGFNAAAPTQK